MKCGMQMDGNHTVLTHCVGNAAFKGRGIKVEVMFGKRNLAL